MARSMLDVDVPGVLEGVVSIDDDTVDMSFAYGGCSAWGSQQAHFSSPALLSCCRGACCCAAVLLQGWRYGHHQLQHQSRVVHSGLFLAAPQLARALLAQDPTKHLVLTDALNSINNGVFFMRNHPWSFEFIRRWKAEGERIHAMDRRWYWDDQGGASLQLSGHYLL